MGNEEKRVRMLATTTPVWLLYRLLVPSLTTLTLTYAFSSLTASLSQLSKTHVILTLLLDLLSLKIPLISMKNKANLAQHITHEHGKARQKH